MKANELQIGDLVNFLIDVEGGDTENDPQNEVYQPMQVNTIASWEVGGEVESMDGVINDPEQLLPIAITAEILEKIGFWREHNVGYVMEEGEYEIIYDLFDHKLRILKNREQILNLEYWGEMCVHELQHALRLCNIDKEIEI